MWLCSRSDPFRAARLRAAATRSYACRGWAFSAWTRARAAWANAKSGSVAIARSSSASPPGHAARISRTWDNGSESALHLLVDESTGMLTYYADPYSSYQRGSNENRNGMIRRYLPKGTSLDDMAQDELDEITRRINGTPLKVLGWLTPAEAWDEQMERLAAQNTPVPGHPVQSTPTHNTRQCCTSN